MVIIATAKLRHEHSMIDLDKLLTIELSDDPMLHVKFVSAYCVSINKMISGFDIDRDPIYSIDYNIIGSTNQPLLILPMNLDVGILTNGIKYGYVSLHSAGEHRYIRQLSSEIKTVINGAINGAKYTSLKSRSNDEGQFVVLFNSPSQIINKQSINEHIIGKICV